MIAAVASVGLTMLFLLGVLDCAIQDVIRNRAAPTTSQVTHRWKLSVPGFKWSSSRRKERHRTFEHPHTRKHQWVQTNTPRTTMPTRTAPTKTSVDLSIKH